jgi:hypothetical protein
MAKEILTPRELGELLEHGSRKYLATQPAVRNRTCRLAVEHDGSGRCHAAASMRLSHRVGRRYYEACVIP